MAGGSAPRIEYKSSVAKDLSRLGRQAALRVVARIETALFDPNAKAVALKGEFEGLFRLRLGDYRVIYVPTGAGFLVLRIGHRKEIYRKGRP